MKQLKISEIHHISVCGKWIRYKGKYLNWSSKNIFNTSLKYEFELFNSNPSRYYWSFENGAKHPARHLTYITFDMYILLN